jgi:hypothetical protein
MAAHIDRPCQWIGMPGGWLQFGDERVDRCRLRSARSSTVRGPRLAEQVVEGVDPRRLAFVGQPLEFEFDSAELVGVEQLAELPLAEQFSQQLAVEGEGGRPALGQGSVPLVQVRGHEREQQRRCERGRRLVSTSTRRTVRSRIAVRTSCSAGRSKSSCRISDRSRG